MRLHICHAFIFLTCVSQHHSFSQQHHVIELIGHELN